MKYKLNIQNFASGPTDGTYINIYINNTSYRIQQASVGTWQDSAYLTKDYVIQNNQVVWKQTEQGVLMYEGIAVSPTDQIIANGHYTLRSIPTIKVGTYRFTSEAVHPSALSQTITFKSNGLSFSKIECANTFGDAYTLLYDTTIAATTIEEKLNFDDINYRIIEIETAQEVSQNFYDWFIANVSDGTSIILSKGRYCFHETLEIQTTPIHFENFKTIFSHINFTGLVLSKTANADVSGYFYSDTNTTHIIKSDGTWLNAQSKEFELTEDYDIAAKTTLSTKEAFAVQNWFEANTDAGRTYHVLNVNGKCANTWNHKPINMFNGNYIERKYNFTGSYTNITNNSYVNPTVIHSTDSIQLILAASTGYELDAAKLVVSNATATFYNSANANILTVYISNPIGNVSVEMTGTIKKYTITTNLTNCIANENNAATIEHNSSVTLYFTANENYSLPDTITLTNVDSYTWNKTSGQLTISGPTDNVVITIAATSTTNTPVLEAGTYQWVDEPEIASLTNILGDDCEVSFTFKSYGDTFSGITLHSYDGSPQFGIRYNSDNDITNHTTKTDLLYTGYSNEKKQFGQYASSKNVDETWTYEWVNLSEYKTITLEEDYIPTEEEKEAFALWYEWAITNGNLVKYEPVLV